MEGVIPYPRNALVVLVIPVAIPNQLRHRVQVAGLPDVEVFVLAHWLAWSFVGESLPPHAEKGGNQPIRVLTNVVRSLLRLN